MNWMSLTEGAILILMSGIGTGVWMTALAVKRIDEHLVALNGRLAKTEQWQGMHERMDEHEFAAIRELLEAKTGQ